MSEDQAATPSPGGRRPRDSIGYLLAKIGAWAGQQFAARLAPLGLEPPHAGILRLVAAMQGASQQELAAALGVPASRMVALIDDLEARGLVERQRRDEDRRAYAIVLTDEGRALGRTLARIGAENEAAITGPLSDDERAQLLSLLQRLAEDADLALDAGAGAGQPPPPRGRPPQSGRARRSRRRRSG